jgi:hypothetical protein
VYTHYELPNDNAVHVHEANGWPREPTNDNLEYFMHDHRDAERAEREHTNCTDDLARRSTRGSV